MHENTGDAANQRFLTEQRYNERKFLRTGTYLHAYCPVCGGGLIEGDWIRFKVLGPADEEGELKLSPRFNVFEKKSSVRLDAGLQIRDLCCPRCGASLIVPDVICGECRSKAVRLRVSAVHMDVDLYICSRMGCHWHGLSQEDQQRLILDSSREW
jgi:predicted RNA-binding Zn-ribbon protein involved in translation (DUF1610 family)